MKRMVLSAVLGLALVLASFGSPQANAQYGYGHHGHGHCHTGYGSGYGSGYRGGYLGGGYVPGGYYGGGYYGGYSTGYRGVPPVVLGQIQTGYPVYRSLPYSNNFGGFYSSGYSGMGYSNFGTGMGYGYSPGISIGIGGFRPQF